MYLKYFQKSKRALRLNSEASTSSVNKNRTYKVLTNNDNKKYMHMIVSVTKI